MLLIPFAAGAEVGQATALDGRRVPDGHRRRVSPAAAVALGAVGSYAILAKTGISTVPTSAVTGNLGVSPAAATFITGFSLTADATNVFAMSPQVTGKVFAADYTPPTPSNLTTAIGDMQLAFTDAAGRAPDVTELGAGNIGGMTLTPGVYKWGTASPDPDGRHAAGQRHRRLDLPDRAGPHPEQRREDHPRRRGAGPERVLAGRGPGRPRHDRARRGRHPLADVDHPADGRVNQRQVAGADGGQPRRQRRGSARAVGTAMIRLRRAKEREHDRPEQAGRLADVCPGESLTLDEDRLAPGAGIPPHAALRRRDRHLRA